jgi:alkyl sulfatase BDS1-like metallo-beta-lactamase superfamily hydrolase
VTTRRNLLTAAPAAGALLALGPAALTTPNFALAQKTAAPGPLWRSLSLVEDTVTAPNGAITTRNMIEANDRLAMTEKRAIKIAPDVWLLAGWGIAHSMAIRAPEGWIIVDTGDSTRTAKEMREKLEAAVGGPVRVAAILLTHWHYADGTAVWADEGTEIWGHEWLDSNRTAGSGVGPLAGFYQARAISQFAVFHPAEGPDAFPNNLRFLPEKLLAESSYRPPARLFTNGRVETFTIAGEKVEVMPNRSDSSDSVGFYFPRQRLLVSNFMVPGFIFNIYSLRGGPYRNPEAFLQDIRRMESYNAAVLLDVHAAPVTGEEAVRDAIRRSGDQVRLIRDQSLRMIARGMDGRAAAEAVFMPPALREGWEFYGQVESHVRQIYNGTVGWFGNNVYDINPLPITEEARRTVALMGGPLAVRAAAAKAATAGDIAGWQWALKLTSLLLQLDAQDAEARKTRATAARALGQRTTSSNARGWYITEALELEGRLFAMGRPVTIAEIRSVLGTPRSEKLVAAGTAANLAFLPVLIDPAKAGGRRLVFTLQVKGDNELWRIEMRNGVILAEPAAAPLSDHIALSPADLADFLLGLSPPAPGTPLAALDAALDRSGFAFLPNSPAAGLAGPACEVHLLGEGSQ